MNLKINFAVCHHFLPCAMARHTTKLPFFAVCLSTWHTAKVALFAVCHTRQTAHVACWVDGVTLFCHGPDKTHGNGFAVCPKKGTRQTPCMPAELCRALFTVCNTRQILCQVFLGLCRVIWHTANPLFPVVVFLLILA